MKWEDRERSSNVRRGKPVNNRGSFNRRGGFGGSSNRGPIFIPSGLGRGKGGIGSIIFILILVFMFRGLFSGGGNVGYDNGSTYQPQQQSQTSEQTGSRARLEDFLAVVLKDTEDVWHEVFNSYDSDYVEPTMVPFQGSTRSACGVANSNMGPFYCPLDQSIYIDVSFYNDLVNKFGGGGDFAFAYVLAHEVGHHVQNQLGILERTNKLRRTLPEREYNKLSVAQELQADYFAGLFAHYVEDKGYLEAGDIKEAMEAASAIGDDRIQEMSGRSVNVDNFTHGSAEQRLEAFMRGYENYNIEDSMVFFEGLDF